LLTLASGHAAGGAHGGSLLDPCVQAAAAVELLHVGTLSHDDVMDEADTRRGAPSVNARWGNARAILTGDVLIARAIRTVAELGPEEARVLAKTLEDLCQGQAMESATLFDTTRTHAAYLRTIELKTASLFATGCQLGALSAGLEPQRALRFAAFGRAIGMAFQVVDDVLDLVGSPERLGKPAGSDLRAGVLTLPVIDALERTPELRDLLSRAPSADTADQARTIIVNCGAVDTAMAQARHYLNEARHVLDRVPGIEERGVAALVRLAESALEQGLGHTDAAMANRLVGVIQPGKGNHLGQHPLPRTGT
jgi:geranylgeranyl pyrophosphate synthase